MPPALAMNIKSMSSAEVADIVQIFGDCNEDWVEAECVLEARETKREKNTFMEGWFTKQQLLDKHNQDTEFVDGVIRNKLKNPKLWMPHPDFPESEAQRLYKAVDYISAAAEQENEVSKNISQKVALEQATVMPLLSTFQMPLGHHGPSASSSAGALALQDAPLATSIPSVMDKSPELLAFEKAQQEKAETLAKRKAEAEALKALPETQANNWEKVMGKHCNDCKGLIIDIQSSNCPADVKADHVKKFRGILKLLTGMRTRLADCTAQDAVQLVKDAPALGVDFKTALKKWKKVSNLLG